MTTIRQIPRGVDRLRRSDSSGFSLVELMAGIFILVTLAAFVLPFTRSTLNALSLSNDARNVAGATSLAKMRAAAYFTKARAYINLGARSFHVERWRKNPAGWVTEGADTTLTGGINFGFIGVATPPPNTQAVISQATQCTNDAGVSLANTACITFNSRGVPIDAANAPTAAGAFYVNDGRTTYGVTVGAGGLIQLWQTSTAVAGWTLR